MDCRIFFGMAAMAALSACAPEPPMPTNSPLAPPVAGTVTGAPLSSPLVPTVVRPTWTAIASPTSTPSAPGRSNVAALATRDLARRLGIAVDGISVESVESDEFPADNLGCLLPGQTPRPIPAIVSGQRIMLRAGGKLYEYRVRGTEVVYCGSR